jgi:DNA-binding MarR family transcriptional regulator
MKSLSYEKLRDILAYWENFEQSQPGADLKSFALWLYRQETEHELATETLNNRFRQETQKVSTHRHKLPLTELQIASHLSRLSRFSRIYLKKALHLLPVSSPEEYSFLLLTARLGNPSKTELIQAGLLEVTTGSDIIRRLLNLGLLEEFTDEQDKRLRRIRLTAAGQEVYQKAENEVNLVMELLAGNLETTQKEQLASVLGILDQFHTSIYREENGMPVPDLIRKYLIA